jgi:hypothetical protein
MVYITRAPMASEPVLGVPAWVFMGSQLAVFSLPSCLNVGEAKKAPRGDGENSRLAAFTR